MNEIAKVKLFNGEGAHFLCCTNWGTITNQEGRVQNFYFYDLSGLDPIRPFCLDFSIVFSYTGEWIWAFQVLMPANKLGFLQDLFMSRVICLGPKAHSNFERI